MNNWYIDPNGRARQAGQTWNGPVGEYPDIPKTPAAPVDPPNSEVGDGPGAAGRPEAPASPASGASGHTKHLAAAALGLRMWINNEPCDAPSYFTYIAHLLEEGKQ
jgi:hypothetical protein